MPGEEKKFRTGGATSWPRLKIRPAPLSWQEFGFDLFATYTRPIVQLVVVMNIVFPYWKHLAEYCLNDLGWSERMFYAMATVGFHHITYAIVNGFYVTIDYFELLQQYRLYTPPISQPSMSLKWEALRGSVLATLPMFAGSYFLGFPLFKYFGMPYPTDPLPSPFKLWVYFCVVKTYATFVFDFVHRIIHSRRFYSKIHAQHHRFIATVSIAAEFAHPIEGISSVLAPLVYGSHPLAWCTWLIWSQVDAGMTHSGYCFHIFKGKHHKLLGLGLNADESAYHHHHHFQNKGNFSAPWLDAIYGTHDAWLNVGKTQGYIDFLNSKRPDQKPKTDHAE